MNTKKRMRLKKFSFHPITTFILMTIGVLILSWLLSILQIQATYTIVRPENLELESVFVSIKNMLNYLKENALRLEE